MARDWLRLFRAQTAPATVLTLIIAYIAGGGRNPIVLGLLFFLGHLLHYASFGHNSLMDYLMGFDRADPNKRHHPLLSGRIDPVTASWVIHGLLFASLILLGALALVLLRPLALLMLFGYAVWGYAYNNGLDHLSERSWVPISLCFAFLPLYGYYLAGSNHLVAALFWLWGFLTTYYQIDWEGNLKDMWNPADRAARKLALVAGCYVDGDMAVCIGRRVLYYYLARAVSHTLALLLGMLLVGPSVWYIVYAAIVYVVTLSASFYLHMSMTAGRRQEVLEAMGKQEVIAFYSLLLLLAPLWPSVMLALALYGVAYFVAMNKLLWSSSFGPKV